MQMSVDLQAHCQRRELRSAMVTIVLGLYSENTLQFQQ